MSKLRGLFLESKLHSIKWSNYFNIYETLFSLYVGKQITFVEVGVLNGGSLLMWRNYFGPKARIIGIDNNPKCKNLEKLGDFEIIIGDQSNPEFWRSLKNQNIRIDILLDDGGHTNKQQIVTVYNSLDLINDDGLIVVEDTHASYMSEFGNPSKYSFIEYCKNLIDILNSRFIRNPDSKIAVSVHSIQFFESIVCFRISRKDSIKNNKVANKPKEKIEDFRFNGNEAIQKISKLRSIRLPLRLKIFSRSISNLQNLALRIQNLTLKDYFKRKD
jgi:hypothetical protein